MPIILGRLVTPVYAVQAGHPLEVISILVHSQVNGHQVPHKDCRQNMLKQPYACTCTEACVNKAAGV